MGKPAAETRPALPASRSPRGCIVAVWVGAALLVLALVFALTVDRSVAGQVEREIGALEAAGKPVTAAEAAPPLVPAADNAAPLYEAAAAAIKVEPESAGRRNWRQPQWLSDAKHALAQNPRALALLATGTRKPACRFDALYPLSLVTEHREFYAVRKLSRLSSTAAVTAALQGDGAVAAQHVYEGLVLARHVSAAPDTIGLLVTCAIDAIAINAAEKVLATGPVSPADSDRLRRELGALDYMAAHARSLNSERAVRIDAYRCFRMAPTQVPLSVFPTRFPLSTPTLGERVRAAAQTAAEAAFRESALLWADELRYLEAAARAEELAPLPWRETHRQLAALYVFPGAIGHASPAAWSTRIYADVTRKRDEAIARRGLLQAALALHRYRAQHGTFPQALSEVRIEGLPIPDDVFSGKPFVYRRVGRSFVLYSIGSNLQDDGGRDDYQAGDLVWELAP